METGMIPEQILEGETGTIHYSYYLPENYDPQVEYPLMIVMPGYDMMWFGEESSGSNLNWDGFLCWTRRPEEMIVVSAQLTDWHETSARQAIELTEYFLTNFSVDTSRVYAAGYSAGGETMSQAVSTRPDLYAAYLHGASQWDGTMHLLQKMAWQFISSWRRMMNITVLNGRGTHTTASMTHIARLDGRKIRLQMFSKFRRRMTSGLPSVVLPETITAAEM